MTDLMTDLTYHSVKFKLQAIGEPSGYFIHCCLVGMPPIVRHVYNRITKFAIVRRLHFPS